MKKTITLRNDFHDTEVRAIPKWNETGFTGTLSASQVRRIKRELCGMDDCICGAIRGSQEVSIEEFWTYKDNTENWTVSRIGE